MTLAVPSDAVPAKYMSQVAQRALAATQQLKELFFPDNEQAVVTTPDAYRLVKDASYSKVCFYQFGLEVLASTFVGTAVNASGDAASLPAVSVDHVRQLAVANMLAAPAVEWETPTVDFVWTPESCRIRQLVMEFNEATHADY